jgi:hypothetical protein
LGSLDNSRSADYEQGLAIAPADMLAGRAEPMWVARCENRARAEAGRRGKAEEKKFAQPRPAELQ